MYIVFRFKLLEDNKIQYKPYHSTMVTVAINGHADMQYEMNKNYHKNINIAP